MPFRPYSVNPPRLVLQVLADAFVVVWIYLWYRVGVAVHDALISAASVGYRVQGNAGGVADNLNRAGTNVGGTPLVGDALAGPLRSAAEQFAGVAGSGRDLGDRLTSASTPLGWLVALGPVLVVVAFWLPARWRFARRAGVTAELAAAPAGQDLLALRALVTRPLHDLQRISPEPVAAWRSGDPVVVHRLAALEVEAAGVGRTALGLPPR